MSSSPKAKRGQVSSVKNRKSAGFRHNVAFPKLSYYNRAPKTTALWRFHFPGSA